MSLKFSAALCIWLLAQQYVASADDTIPQDVRDVLRWLPARVSTVAVSAQHEEYVAFPSPEGNVKDLMRQFMSRLPYNSLSGTDISAVVAAFHGASLRLAVQGATNYRGVSKGQFVDSAYDGLHILVFDDLSDHRIKDVTDSLKAREAQESKISEYDVFVMPRKDPSYGREWLVAFPMRNVVIIATERAMLEQCLARIRDTGQRIDEFVEFALDRVPTGTAMWAAAREEASNPEVVFGWVCACDSKGPDVMRIDYIAKIDLPLPVTGKDREALIEHYSTVWSLQRNLGVKPKIEVPAKKEHGRLVSIQFALSRREIAVEFIRVLLSRLGRVAS